MSKKQANKTIVYFRKRKTNETVKEVANVVASSAQQGIIKAKSNWAGWVMTHHLAYLDSTNISPSKLWAWLDFQGVDTMGIFTGHNNRATLCHFHTLLNSLIIRYHLEIIK
uniref:Uncharacterized protein n=1 Tax=Solanum lycopersicum TaxID=4081 RepID=K4B097_SOLLC